MYDLLLHNGLGLLFGLTGLFLLLAVLHRAEAASSRFVSHRLGWNGVLLTGCIGVPIHELSHLISAKLFGHRVVGWRLFEPDPATGTLGYVRHAYTKRSAWQLGGQFFIGVAPVVGGGIALLALLVWMLPSAQLPQLWAELRITSMSVRASGMGGLAELGIDALLYVSRLGSSIWEGRSLWLPLQLYLGTAIACHLAPSARDLEIGFAGWMALAFGLLVLLLLTSLAGLRLSIIPIGLFCLTVVALLALAYQLFYVAALALYERLRHRSQRSLLGSALS